MATEISPPSSRAWTSAMQTIIAAVARLEQLKPGSRLEAWLAS